jgi:hypothetical protein
MAVTHDNSVELDNVITDEPREMNPVSSWGGKVQFAFFTHDQSGTGDAGSDVGLVKLPAGRVRVILPLSKAYVNWTTGSALLDLGWDAYTGLDGVAVVADPDGLADDIDVESAGFFDLGAYATLPAAMKATCGTKVFTSKDGVTLRATSPTAMVSGDDLVGYIAYVCD